MRRFVVATVLVAVLAATPGALGKPILGITGNTARFKAQTTQTLTVVQAFLGWGQGSTSRSQRGGRRSTSGRWRR